MKIYIDKGLRRCYVCKEVKTLDCFYNNKAGPGGKEYICKDCRNIDTREKSKSRRLKLRFEILNKFNFTCQYCGRKAPEVILEVDHIIPKSKNGLNDIDNYTVACKECNIGKGDSILEEYKELDV